MKTQTLKYGFEVLEKKNTKLTIATVHSIKQGEKKLAKKGKVKKKLE